MTKLLTRAGMSCKAMLIRAAPVLPWSLVLPKETCRIASKFRSPKCKKDTVLVTARRFKLRLGATAFGSLTAGQAPSKARPQQSVPYNGVFLLLLVNVVVFILDKVIQAPWISSLYLSHREPHWWQFLTAAFCHASWQHISSNTFMLLIFGRIVEEEEGMFGVLATYVFCAFGASLASFLLQPGNIISLGASGAVFGLFVVSVLCKLSLAPRKLLECLILGQFVMQQVIQEARLQLAVKGSTPSVPQVGHLAHLYGALAGVLLVYLLSRIPAPINE